MEIAKTDQKTGLLDLAAAKDHMVAFNQFKKELCRDGVDYGRIPGTNKPTLFKPGAEKLRVAFHLRHEVQETSKTIDLEAGFVDFEYKVIIRNQSGELIGEGIGSCNSWEDKYLFTGWRNTKKKPSDTEKYEAESQSIGRYRKAGNAWIWQERRRKPVNELVALKNTIQKMAKKRAFVDAILTTTGGSEFFTQDVEDMNLPPDWEDRFMALLMELRALYSWAAKKVASRDEATQIYKLVASAQNDPAIIKETKALANKFPKDG